MSGGSDYYSLREVSDILGISYDAVRMRIKRGTCPARFYHDRLAGIPKVDFWAVCAQQERDGLIWLKGMPQAYKDERRKYLEDRSVELKVCPFCGGAAELRETRAYATKGWRVVCSKGCAATLPTWIDVPIVTGNGINEATRYTSTQAAAVAVANWNRRTTV